MIKVTYNKETHELRMKGHANSEKKGKDIVCASASMLCYTLAQALSIAKSKKLDELELKIYVGKAKIKCIPKAGYERDIDLVYSTINAGFLCLAKNYPQYVNFCVL